MDHILAFHITALKTFGPGNEGALEAGKSGQSNDLHGPAAPPPAVPIATLPHLVQACLVTREGEAEPQLQTLIAHGQHSQELRQAAGGKVKELWDGVGGLTLPTGAPAALPGPDYALSAHLLTRTQHHFLGDHKLLAPGLHLVPLDAR